MRSVLHSKASYAGFYFLVSLVIVFAFATLVSAATNLVSNSNFETTDVSGNPVGWSKGKWGTNTVVFTYDTIGGNHVGSISMSNRTSGDAKWAFTPISVTPDTQYEYSDRYSASVPTWITVEFLKTDGSLMYMDLANPAAQASSTTLTPIRFTTPPGTAKIRVFHLINANGTLTIDDVSVIKTGAAETTNLIPNPQVEQPSMADPTTPVSWKRGGFGTNARTYSYPVVSGDGSRAVNVSISSYTSGDAKWYFVPVPVTTGSELVFTDKFKSDVESQLCAQFEMTAGGFTFQCGPRYVATGASWKDARMFILVPAGAKNVTIFHLIKSVGSLTTDAHSLIAVSSGKFTQGMVTLTYDDSLKSQYDFARPMLEAANIPASFYAVTQLLGTPGYMTTAEVLDLSNRGFEVGPHTRTHVDLTTLTSSALQSEVSGSKNDIALLGALPNSTFAYPLGAYNDNVIAAVKTAGLTGARNSVEGYNTKNSDHYQLVEQKLLRGTTVATAQSWIDTAINDRTWLILGIHDVTTSNTGPYTITPATMQAVIDYLKLRGVSVVTLNQGIQMLNP